MDQIPLANASTKLTARGSAPTAATLTTMWRPSTSAAPAITGTARRKLNSAAAAGPRPPHNAAHTVEPERETPRNTAARACAKPHAAPPRHAGRGLGARAGETPRRPVHEPRHQEAGAHDEE